MRKIEKIYSRNKIKIPRIKCFFSKNVGSVEPKDKEKIRKISKILVVLTIAFVVANMMLKAVEPVINSECVTMARSIATKISNEQSSIVMENYQYEDLITITKDENSDIKMVRANINIVNRISSDIPNLIQEELNKQENSTFCIKLGNFTGTRLLAGRGPDIEIKMSTIGDIQTNLRSEFTSAGINQTLHRIYLEITCKVVVLTPFQSIEEEIVNQVLLAEGVIVGNIPSTYYSLNGIENNNLLDIVE